MNLLLHAAILLAFPLYADDAPGTISADLLRQPIPVKAKEILRKAQRAADLGDHDGAIKLLQSAHDKYPDSAAWTQSMLGVEYLKTRQFDAALSALEQAVALLPRDAVDHSNLAFALASTGRYAEAEEHLRCALELDNGNLKIRALLDFVRKRNIPITSSQP